MHKEKILITGVSGLLGSNLAFFLKDKYEVEGWYLNHPIILDGVTTAACDVSFASTVRERLIAADPDIVIHCASLANVDQCGTNTALAERLNHLSAKHVVEAVLERKTKLVYISTDAVYSGEGGNFSEEDPIYPQNYYGISKYLGEWEFRRRDDALIIRTNFFGWNIQNKESIGEWVINRLQAGERIFGFTDAIFSSIYTFDFARILQRALEEDLSGILNIGSRTAFSKYTFALKLCELFGFDASLISPRLIQEHAFMARRGKNLSLNVQKIERVLGTRMPTLEESIIHFHDDYRRGLPERMREQNKTILLPFLNYGRQYIDEVDVEAVTKALLSTHLTQGPRVASFEKAICEKVDAHDAVAVNSGTSALHIACVVAGVGPGDEVITSPITFVASANCAVYCGAMPVFADIDPKTYNISPEEIEKKITKKTKAIIPVHFAGQSCDMERIRAVVRAAEEVYHRKIYIIEDASHALGSFYKKTKVGSCAFSDMVVMSFHPVKHITTGEGGAVLTNNAQLVTQLRRLRSHGITGNLEEFTAHECAWRGDTSEGSRVPNPWYYEQQTIGYNYRITDIQCALGISQLTKLERFRARRREIVSRYNEAFCMLGHVQIPFESPDNESNFHLYVLLFDFKKIGLNRAQFMDRLKEKDIQTQVHYIPVYLQPFYRSTFGTNWGDCPHAEAYYEKCLSIPLFPAMSDSDIERVITEITKFI